LHARISRNRLAHFCRKALRPSTNGNGPRTGSSLRSRHSPSSLSIRTGNYHSDNRGIRILGNFFTDLRCCRVFFAEDIKRAIFAAIRRASSRVSGLAAPYQ
jgi:hypothetical protein